MIRRALRVASGRAASPEHPSRTLPLGMFAVKRAEREVRSARVLARLYHKGQERAWNGQDVLAELVERHGGVSLPQAETEALRNLLAVIFWGELAAWKVSAALAEDIEPLEAKMAATAQAHDEARHFYVMHDYLELLGEVPQQLRPATRRVLDGTLGASSLAKMLLGMQLMIEPLALTLFQLVREREIEPVLCDLLTFYERDEARHVALGVHYLPRLLEGMNRLQAADLYLFQIREYNAQFAVLREVADDFRALGIEPREVFLLARRKQILAVKLLMEELGTELPVVQAFRRLTDVRGELELPEDPSAGMVERMRSAWRVAWTDIGDVVGPLTTAS